MEEMLVESVDLPVACSLTAVELQERRRQVLQNVRSAVVEVKELDDGYGYRFPSDGRWISELTNLIELERQCCPFMRFNLRLEPDQGPIWLELSGPAGTKDFLNTLFE
jgi:hypothetical protein